MQLRHILAATDESEAGRQAVRCAVALGARAQARITILRVMPGATPGRVVLATGKTDDQDRTPLGQLRRWLEAGVLSGGELDAIQLGIAYGLPGIEICRVAEQVHADLLVVGRRWEERRGGRVRRCRGVGSW